MKAFLAAAERHLGEPLERDRYLVVGNARWKRSVFIYRPNEARPGIVAKIPTNPEAQAQCAAEDAGLRCFAEYTVPGVRAPRPLGSMVHLESRCFFQESIPSKQLLGELRLTRRRMRARHLRTAARSLGLIYNATRESHLQSGHSFAHCFQHGDFWIGNVGASRRNLVVYDFEYAKPSGRPLFDLLHFALYYQVALRNVGRVGRGIVKGQYNREGDERTFHPLVSDVRRLFVVPGATRTLMSECVNDYRIATGMSREDIRFLVSEYIEVDRGISGLAAGWEAAIV